MRSYPWKDGQRRLLSVLIVAVFVAILILIWRTPSEPSAVPELEVEGWPEEVRIDHRPVEQWPDTVALPQRDAPGTSDIEGIPRVPGSKILWRKEEGSATSVKYISDRTPAEVGLFYLDNLPDNWVLDISHVMTRSGYGWTGTFFSDHRTRFLAIIAHSRVIGSRPGGERNPTEIAVVLFRGGEGVEGVEWLWDGSEDWEELEKQLIEDKHLQSTP